MAVVALCYNCRLSRRFNPRLVQVGFQLNVMLLPSQHWDIIVPFTFAKHFTFWCFTLLGCKLEIAICTVQQSSSIKLSATDRLLDITHTTTPAPSSLANSDNPDKLTRVWPSTLQTVSRWRHNEYSCCSHPSFSHSFHASPDQWSDYQTWCGKMRTTDFQLWTSDWALSSSRSHMRMCVAVSPPCTLAPVSLLMGSYSCCEMIRFHLIRYRYIMVCKSLPVISIPSLQNNLHNNTNSRLKHANWIFGYQK